METFNMIFKAMQFWTDRPFIVSPIQDIDGESVVGWAIVRISHICTCDGSNPDCKG